MKKFFLLTGLVICTGITIAQTDAAAKYAAGITGTNLNKYLSIIASAEMEGRETGTEGQRKAAAYIESQFKTLGLKSVPALNGYQQFYPLYQDSLKATELTIDGKTAEYGKDFIAPLTNNENGKFKGKKLIFVGYGIDDEKYSDYTNLDVKGKIVIFFLGEPKKDGKFFLSGSTRASEWTFPGVSKKIGVAAAKGAAGVLIINPTTETFNQRAVDNGKKTGVYFPRAGAQGKQLNFAQLSHAFAKELMGSNFDTLVKISRASGHSDGFQLRPKRPAGNGAVRACRHGQSRVGELAGECPQQAVTGADVAVAHY